MHFSEPANHATRHDNSSKEISMSKPGFALFAKSLLHLVTAKEGQAFFSTDAGHCINAWGADAQTLFGWAPDEFLGRSLPDMILSPDSRFAYDNAVRAVRLHRASAQARAAAEPLRLQGRRKNGTLLSMELSLASLDIGQETPSASVSATASMLENKQAELLRQQAALLVLSSDAIVVTDLNSTILFWNAGACLMFGFAAEEALGQICHVLLLSMFPSSLEDTLLQVLESGHWEGE